MVENKHHNEYSFQIITHSLQKLKTMLIKHFLLDEKDNTLATFDTFNADAIKAEIVKYLTANPGGSLTHEKTQVNKKYAGNEILNWYEVNKKNGQPSKACYNGAGKFIGYRSLIA